MMMSLTPDTQNSIISLKLTKRLTNQNEAIFIDSDTMQQCSANTSASNLFTHHYNSANKNPTKKHSAKINNFTLEAIMLENA